MPPIFPILPIFFLTGAGRGLATSSFGGSSSELVSLDGRGGGGDADVVLSLVATFAPSLPGGGEIVPSDRETVGFPLPPRGVRETTTVSESSVSSPAVAAISGISKSGICVGGLGFSVFLLPGFLSPATIDLDLGGGETVLEVVIPAPMPGTNLRGGGRSRSSESDLK